MPEDLERHWTPWMPTTNKHEIVSRPCYRTKTSISSDEKLMDSSTVVTAVFKLVLSAEHRPSPLEFRKGTSKLYIHRHREEAQVPTQVMWEEEVQFPPW